MVVFTLAFFGFTVFILVFLGVWWSFIRMRYHFFVKFVSVRTSK
jgi:hypothetical protein